jgi:esterase/lipase
MKIEIKNQEAFVDEKIHIKISELSPLSHLKITFHMELPWCSGELFSSYAIFQPDDKGEVDLEHASPIEGTYENANSIGLLYSLRLTTSYGKNIAENINIENPILIKISFETSSDQRELTLKRFFKSKDIVVKKINHTFTGQLFYKEHSRRKTILMLGGSDGNLDSLSLMAGPLASRGFNVLTVSYFGTINLPEKLEEVPLEYFEKIFDWIKTNESTESEEIYIHGTSKGGELALLLASKYPQIKKVVAVEPHAYCFQALNGLMIGANASSWSYKRKSVPFIKVRNEDFYQDLKLQIDKGVPFGFCNTYKKSLLASLNKEEARIKVEDSNADLLLICGEEDNIWNSYEACQEIINHLKRTNYKHRVELLSYPQMGHPLPVPFIIPASLTTAIPMNGGIFSTGGTLLGNAEGQYDSFQRTINFFQDK